MSDTDLLRASRDGDQFHYHWAARQALKLLRPDADLTAIAIEGVSPNDTRGEDGEDVIDIAEYYGGTSLFNANRVVYRQLKHSTARATEEWSVSGLSKTVKGFAEKFRQIRKESPGIEEKVTFEFLSNRPIRESVLRAIGILADGGEVGEYAHDVKYLRQYANFSGDAAGEAAFFGRLEVDATAPGLLRLEGLFRLDLTGLLPGAADVQPLLLKEMITRRATSLEANHVVERSTVLTALGASPEHVMPAPKLIDEPEHTILTEQTRAIVDDIIGLTGRPVVVHAAGGVGKSVLTTQIERNLPSGSIILVYDCFGNGSYRRSSSPRHQHQQGLVQLANELAAHALCDPLIPVGTAQPTDYAKAFMARVRAAAAAVAASAPGALLVLVVDAADNAALIARDGGERTFVTDMLREALPDNVRLVMLCRTERIGLLEPPPSIHRIELKGFGIADSRQHLESVFGPVTEAQAAEFHRRTGGNPRIQALVLATASDLRSCLVSLGEARHPDDPLFDELLQGMVDQCKDANHLSTEIDRLCEALAALRPRMPINVLTKLCKVPAALVHSFAADLGRPLLVDGDTLQFRDEPTETWFRTTYRPTGDSLSDFINRLTPLAADEPYVAASLPQLLWEAGQVDTLVEMAMTDSALPACNDLERREIAQQRAQFALKATLRVGREWEATRLAVKAGSLAAGHSRRLHLLRSNTDLAGQFLDAITIEDIVANRSLVGDWPGSNLHYEGALLSFAEGQTDFAGSRLRSASEWLRAWVRQPNDDSNRHSVTATDIAEVALGLLNTDGVEACVSHLARWRPDWVSFEAGVIIATRLADSGRTAELERLGHAAVSLKYLQFAVAYAAWKANIVCQAPLARRLVRMLKRQRRPVSVRWYSARSEENKVLPAVVWIIAMGLRHGLLPSGEAERILCLNLPGRLSRGAGSRWGRGTDTITLLCGFALLSKIRLKPFDVEEIAGEDVTEAREKPHVHSSAVNDHKRNVVPLGVWARLLIDCLVGTASDTDSPFQELVAPASSRWGRDELPHFLHRGIARLGVRILAFGSSEASRQNMLAWYRSAQRHLPENVLIDAVRVAAAVDELQHIAVELAESVAKSLDLAQENAESKAEQMVKLARAIQQFDKIEAHTYFTQAIDLTDRVGDDAHALWRALIAVAHRASDGNHSDERRAYRVAQITESLEPYLGDAIEHSEVLAAMGYLSATTAMTVASRWRDRRFCSQGPIIQALLDEEPGPLAPSAVTASALLPFGEHHVDGLRLVERALRETPGDGKRIAETLGLFLRARRFSSASFERLDATVGELDIDLSGTLLAPSARHIAFPASRDYTSGRWASNAKEDEARLARSRQFEDALGACDLSTAEGWEQARQIVIASERSLHMEQVIDQAVTVPLRELDNMLAAFQANPNLRIFDYARMVKRLAELTLLPRAARRQLRHLAHTAAARFCRELTTKVYDPLDLSELARLADEPDADLLATALRELGSQAAVLPPEDCHHLAARLVPRLTGAQAQTVLDDFDTMLTDLSPEDSGDGRFADLPAGPTSAAECLAGYLWTVLGDPEHDARWRAAHCVWLLAELGCQEELEALLRFALGTLDVTPFHDARLPFYDRHARQWLLFALARAAQNSATHQTLAVFEPLLRKVIFDDEPHVVMQESAKTICMALDRSGAGILGAEELAIVRRINIPMKILTESWVERAARRRNGKEEETYESEPDNFHFFWDFKDIWCKPLGEAFGIPEEAVLRLAGQAITGTWGLPYRGTHEDDPRHTLRLYREGSTFSYRTTRPEAEDLDFYLSTHALWTVAGELLKDQPVYKDSDADLDQFTYWLRDFHVTRDDGRWLADRRDPSPQSVLIGRDNLDAGWVWRLNSRHFSERLISDDGWIRVWESSDDAGYEAAQSVLIRSALVTPARARALVLALQTAPSYMGYRIPNADDSDYQFDVPGFQLTGWIVDPDRHDGIDSKDPLAAGIKYPPYMPSDEFIDLFGLQPDADMREWTRGGGIALRSTYWTDTSATSSDRVTGTQGQRLEIQPNALQELLNLTGRSMIIEVMIDRTHKEHEQSYTTRFHQDDDESLPPRERSYKIYLFDESGRCEEL
ncbi:hypothetical protein [Actinomadura macra]|uniref:hypothetical protein n=1 Tax=Actinomadura macra TaxID=46164 RepID=UPI000A9EA516|nr:hypothetical protein [Actinomadura macra]